MTHEPRLKRRAFTLAELLVVLAILASLTYAGWWVFRPRLCICREVSKRLVCASNLKGIGTSMMIYANDNGGAGPTPAFDETMIGSIDYTVPAGSGSGTAGSPNRFQESIGGPAGTRQLGVTRAFWMLVRSGDVTAKQFVCPSSGDVEDPTPNLNACYDFAGPGTISYGFQVPFGPKNTRAYEGVDNGMILAADRGPYGDANAPLPPASLAKSLDTTDPRVLKQWHLFNSRNHQGEGQSLVFADGHVAFGRMPVAGADYDNIYTIALDNQLDLSRRIGESPWRRSAPPFAPPGNLSSTDSVIFP